MSNRSPLRLIPRDPTLPPPRYSAYEVSSSLAARWEPWHAGDPLPYRYDPRDPGEIDARVRDLAWIEIERLWDEMDLPVTATGEIVEFSVFPPLMGLHRWRFLVSSWCPDGAEPTPDGTPRVLDGGND